MLLPLRRDFTYGPVHSRRLGRSLGINVLPTDLKVCNFNCVYCQYGWTRPEVLKDLVQISYPPAEAILLAVAKELLSLAEPAAYLTFSGHGEATLHPHFSELVEGVTRLRDRFMPAARTAILSNSSTVSDPEIRTALSRLDERIMKLDAGTPAGQRRFNQPVKGVRFEELVEGLRLLGGVTVQTLFAAGPSGNLHAREVEAWHEALERIAPVAVQIYTLDRAFPSDAIAPAPREALEEIAARVHDLGFAAKVF